MIEEILTKMSATEAAIGAFSGAVLLGWRARIVAQRLEKLENFMSESKKSEVKHNSDIRILQDSHLKIMNQIEMMSRSFSDMHEDHKDWQNRVMETHKAIGAQMIASNQQFTDILKTVIVSKN